MVQRSREGRARRLSSEQALREVRARVLRLCEALLSQPGLEMKLRAGLSSRGATGPPG